MRDARVLVEEITDCDRRAVPNGVGRDVDCTQRLVALERLEERLTPRIAKLIEADIELGEGGVVLEGGAEGLGSDAADEIVPEVEGVDK